MIHHIFTIFDTKTEDYSPPFYSPSLAAGERAFQDASAEPDSMLNKHPDDFQLFYLGSYDSEIAGFTPQRPQRIK